MSKIKVKSLVNGTVFINDPTLGFKRTWERKGQVRLIEKEVLEQIIYSPGVEYMFKEGILGIIDEDALKIKVDLGLEEEGEEEKIIILDDARMKEILALNVPKFKEAVDELTREQAFELANYCINNEYTNFSKIEALKKVTGIDIFTAIRLNRENQEKVEEE